MAVNIGPRIGIDGEAEYRKQIQSIIQETKTLKSEYDKVSSALEKDTSAIKKNSEQKKILNQQIDAQQKRISELSRMMDESAKKYGENDQKTLKWKESVNKATTELNGMRQQLKDLPNKVQLLGDEFATAGDEIKGVGDRISSIGRALVPMSAAATGALAGSAKAAIDFESAFTGVQKTVDATAEEYAQLSDWIKDASTQMASSKEDIAGVMEVSGQLGVSGVANLEEFTKTMVMLGDTTNLSAEDAATSLARFMNITGTAYTESSNLGSTIVELGNNFATSESEIVEMATRLASAGTIAGLTETDILALSASMSSVGINAEAGGTAMTQTLSQMTKSVSDFRAGQENDLNRIAEISNMSAEEFATAWESEPITAIQAFIEGLDGLDEKGENATLVLDELGMSGIRQSNMLKSLALASDVLGEAINSAGEAFENNNALQDEAALRYDTTASKMEQAKEKLSNIGIEVGERLLPYAEKGLDMLDKLVSAWDSLSTEQQDSIVKIAAIVAAAAPLLTIGGQIVSGAGALVSAGGTILGVMGNVGEFIGSTMIPAIGSLIAAAAPILASAAPFIAVGAAIVGAGVLIYKNWDTIKEKAGELKETVSQKWSELKDNADVTWNNIKTKATETWENVKSTISTKSQNAAEYAKGRLQDIYNAYVENGGGIEGVAAATWEVLTSKYETGYDLLNTLTKGKLGEQVELLKKKGEDMKNAVKSAIDKIKSVIKLPHFKISGSFSLNPPSVPSIGVDWYAKAMDNGMILNRATIFGAANGKLLGGGEAGAEAIVGVNSLKNMITNAVQTALLPSGDSMNLSYGDTIINVYGAPGQDVEELADIIEEKINYKIQAQNAVMA